MILDGSEQPVPKSINKITENKTFSGKYMANTVILLVGVNSTNGHVMWVSRSFVGKNNDQTIYNQIPWSAYLNPDEKILADKGFSDKRVIRKTKKNDIDQNGDPIDPFERKERSRKIA